MIGCENMFLRIGTRGSPLAVIQAELVRDGLLAAHNCLKVDVVKIMTTGDRIQDRTLADIGGKGLFTKEIEKALVNKHIDIAVHSAKDMLTELPDGLVLGPILKREDSRDALISRSGERLDKLSQGAIVGTASLRRQAQILSYRPDLSVIPFRGNVATRLQKLNQGLADATLLAVAGLNRLQKLDVISEIIGIDVLLPAAGQGAICLEIRADDEYTANLCAILNHKKTAVEVLAERSILAVLDGSCRTPIGVLGNVNTDADTIILRAMVAKPDGSVVHKGKRRGLVKDAELMGLDLGQELKKKSAGSVLKS